MYQDELLILVGAIATSFIILLALYLIFSRKKAVLYLEILGAETTAFENLTSTISSIASPTTLNIKAPDAEFDPEVFS